MAGRKIESLFRHLKSNAYHLEDLNIREEGKNLLLFALATTADVLAIRLGLKRQQKIPINQYRDGSRWPKTSIFSECLVSLTRICYQFVEFLSYIFKFFSKSKNPIFKNVQ
jgi:hypothetical protein